MTDELSIWTIYDHPADYPELFVARLWTVGQDGVEASHTMTAETLELLQGEMEKMNLTRMDRRPEDDPVIVETWM